MPPFLPRKRLASTPPDSARVIPAKKAKLSDALDSEPRGAPSLQTIKEFALGDDDDDDDSESLLSDINSDEFEDVPRKGKALQDAEEDDEHEDIDWEDAVAEGEPPRSGHIPMANGNLELTFSKTRGMGDDPQSLTAASGAKRGPTKRQRQVRIQTHCMHVQFLLYHNAIRNKWICDRELQDILVKQLPQGITKEVEKWRVASGLDRLETSASTLGSSSHKGKRRKHKAAEERNERDWGRPSQRLEPGTLDLSHGDPLIPLMKVLSAYWKKRFTVTAPGLRKRGYTTPSALRKQIASFRNDEYDAEIHGERIRDIGEFRELARKCEGSRDVGAQFFTALLRGLGIESRLVANLQPIGFGWTKTENAAIKEVHSISSDESSSVESDEEVSPPAKENIQAKRRKAPAKRRSGFSNGQGNKNKPIDLEESSSADDKVEDDDSVIDVTPTGKKQPHTKFDRDLPFPIYWTETVSPVTHTIIPVSPLNLKVPVATSAEALWLFEPRGARAEKAKQVMAYVIAYSSDGSAKDVTVRYSRRKIWPGKTKGFRMPIEKVPVYNKRGKVKRYEEYDWCKIVMSGYVRSDHMRTAVDDIEDSLDLVPHQPEKKEARQDGDTLQSLKASADFVLERFLRREEALRPNAKSVRTFTSGKGDKLKEEPVYRRADVERCLSAESWHKEGRRTRIGERPMKLVPVRAVTLTRKREVEEAERQSGEKPMQGLYCWDQTEYIIPPPIENGVIPKNSYGNMDCFVPTMVPRGAVHVPLRGVVKICKKLKIDYAEAVTGFEFGNKRAVPVVTGVVVAQENEEALIDAWEAHEAEARKKEEGKQEKLILNLWRKMVMGLRIHERVHEEYGEEVDHEMEYGKGGSGMPARRAQIARGAGNVKAPVDSAPAEDDFGEGGFLLPHEDDEQAMAASELVMEHDEPVVQDRHTVEAQYPTPVSSTSMKPVETERASARPASETRPALSDVETSPTIAEVDDSEQGVAVRLLTASDGMDSHVDMSLSSKRGRGKGRVGRAASSAPSTSDEPEAEVSEEEYAPPKRRRGRPRKAKAEAAVASKPKPKTERSSARRGRKR